MADIYRLNVFDETLIFIGDLEVTQVGRLVAHCNRCGEYRVIPIEKVPAYIEMLKRRGVRNSSNERLIDEVGQEIERLGGEGTSGQLNKRMDKLLSSLSN